MDSNSTSRMATATWRLRLALISVLFIFGPPRSPKEALPPHRWRHAHAYSSTDAPHAQSPCRRGSVSPSVAMPQQARLSSHRFRRKRPLLEPLRREHTPGQWHSGTVDHGTVDPSPMLARALAWPTPWPWYISRVSNHRFARLPIPAVRSPLFLAEGIKPPRATCASFRRLIRNTSNRTGGPRKNHQSFDSHQCRPVLPCCTGSVRPF